MQSSFIVLEGPDGSGTTTHLERLQGYLVSKGMNVLATREPTVGPIGSFIRSELRSDDLSPMSLQLLFCADRAWHLGHDILPALEAGKVVLSDRYTLSTLAYGEALGLDPLWLKQVTDTFVVPDLQIVLLPSIDVTEQRLRARATNDLLEAEDLQKAIHAAYRRLSDEHGLTIIDSSGPIDTVAAEIFAIVDRFLTQPR